MAMTEDHKKKLAVGRNISSYLNRLNGVESAPRGRAAADPDKKKKELEAKLKDTTSPMERMKLRAKIANIGKPSTSTPAKSQGMSNEELEAFFIANAKSYAEDNGFTKAMFLEEGVPADVLSKAKITK